MSKWQIILIFFLMIGISSCNKDSDEELIEYPLTFTSYLITESEIKIYIKDGEITLPDSKNKIIQRYKNYLTDLESAEIQGKVIATYLSENTVELTFDNIKEEKSRLVYEKDGLIYWEKQDTSVFTNSSFFHFSDLLNYVPLYYEEFNVPAIMGYRKAIKGKECYFVIRDNEKFKLPMLDYIYKNEIAAIVITEVNNVFNENSIVDLYLNDTIIVKEYMIKLE